MFKRKPNSIQKVQEAESDENQVFSVYYQRVIEGKKTPYVANGKIQKENVALEIDTGASVSILNRKTCELLEYSEWAVPIVPIGKSDFSL